MSENNLGSEPIGTLLLRLAAPSICAQIVNMLYNIVDRIFIGHIPDIGSDALTGVGVGFPIIMLLSAFAALIGMGGAPRASIRMGEQKLDLAEQILGNCFSCLVGLSIVLTVFFQATKEPLLRMFGASDATMPYALEYLQIYIFGTVFVLIALGMNTFLSAQGLAMLSMATVVIGAVLNIALDAIFIFGMDLGVRGAALATIISQMVSAIWVIRVLCGKRGVIHLRKSTMKPQAKVMLPVLALGASPFVMQSTESLLSITFNVSLQKFGGDMAVGAMTILTSLMQMLNLPLMGLASGAQPIIGYNLGARNAQRVKKTIILLTCIALSYTTLFWLGMQLLPTVFAAIFSADAALISFTAWAIRIYFATCFILAFQFGLQQSFIALGEAKVSLFLAILRKIILLIPLILILPHFFTDKVFAVFLAEPVSDFISATVVIIIFCRKFRKIMREIQTDNHAK